MGRKWEVKYILCSDWLLADQSPCGGILYSCGATRSVAVATSHVDRDSRNRAYLGLAYTHTTRRSRFEVNLYLFI